MRKVLSHYPETDRVIQHITFDEQVIASIENNKEDILQYWLHMPTIVDIRQRFSFSQEYYYDALANKIFNYFISILKGKNQPGDCPIMRQVVSEMIKVGLNVEDVFLNCTAFKNALITFFINDNNPLMQANHASIFLLLDYNLFSILSIYSDKMHDYEEEIASRSQIIDDNVLFVRTDVSGIIIEVSEAYSQLTGFKKEELMGRTHSIVRHPDVDDVIYEDLWLTILAGEEWQGMLQNRKKDGTNFFISKRIIPVLNTHKEIIEFISFGVDMTNDKLSGEDPLTHLYNRRAFDKQYKKITSEADMEGHPISIILADIDHFKLINDRYGHSAGDEILVKFAKIFLDCTRSDDICVRWGGEEFVAVLPRTTQEQAYGIAERIRETFQNSQFFPDGQITCSIGVTQKRISEKESDLFDRVDYLMYKAKNLGRNTTCQ